MGVRLTQWRKSRSLALVVVTVAQILDAVLITVLVPILPDLLKQFQYAEAAASRNASHPQHEANSSTATDLADVSASALTTKIGFLLASKMLVEVLVTPFFGIVADRFGYTVPMLIGFFVTFTSTLLFAFVESYELLFIARSIQGLGSAGVFAPGVSLLAENYPDDKERANAISIAYGGLIFGTLIGPIYGGVVYQFYGKTVTFSILAVAALVDGVLRAAIIEPTRKKRSKTPSITTILTDPYILINLGAVFFVNFGYSMLETILPAWMMDTMHTNSAEQGLAFVPLFLTILMALSTLNRLNFRVRPYWTAIAGFILMGFSLAWIPLARTQLQLVLPTVFMGLSIGMADSYLLPQLARLVDLRHHSQYGFAYSIDHCIWCFSYVLGASLGGTLQTNIGFQSTLGIAAIAGILYTPLIYLLRNPGTAEEEKPLTQSRNSETRHA